MTDQNHNDSKDDHIIFTSMGMFIIDEIHFPNAPSVYDIIGGGGTFGALGSRIILRSSESKRVGWIVDFGNDCPPSVEETVASWGTGAIVRHDNSRQTTRGWNHYGDNELRNFKYLTPKKRIDVDDLVEYPKLLMSDSFHLICSPERCTEIMGRLNKEREAVSGPTNRVDPVIIWEPIPDDCVPEHLERCLAILDHIDVLSPNAQEGALLFGLAEPDNKPDLELVARRFLPYLTKPDAGVVLRCGRMGSYILNNKGLSKWLPLYHGKQFRDYKVTDTTGGGNTFVGALATGFVKSNKDWIVAAICGNVASGAAIEQVGMPELSRDGQDKWNGLTVEDRIRNYFNKYGDEVGMTYEEVSSKLYGTEGARN